MSAALLLLIVSLADVAVGLVIATETIPDAHADGRRATSTRMRVALAAGGVVAVAVAGLGVAGGAPLWLALVSVAFAASWLGAGWRFTHLGRPTALLALSLLLVVAMIALLLFVPATLAGVFTTSGLVPAGDGATGIPATLVVAAVAVVAALTRTSNLICRAALGRTVLAPEREGSRPPRRWSLALGTRRIATLTDTSDAAADADDAPPAPLQGGRVIGPLERILLTALALSGAQAVIVGLLAAKGVVRFPEINADNRRGSKAEEFLVGSLVSWTLAGLAAAFLFALQNS
ncbi:hypothetical protein AB0N73_09150 [Microbacterium sp. NPDC089189]|uniref:hypothetical protein n=1 Tax=Microbacterium sp. NPDC089189 TaxID=3154972 RepID=UPI00341545AD